MKIINLYNDNHSLVQLLEEIEHFYINYFSRKNPKKGVEILKLVARDKTFSSSNSFLFGLYFGVILFLILNIIIHKLELDISENNNYYYYFPMYRGISLLIIYTWFLALAVYVWNKNFVNYKVVFKFNHHHS